MVTVVGPTRLQHLFLATVVVLIVVGIVLCFIMEWIFLRNLQTTTADWRKLHVSDHFLVNTTNTTVNNSTSSRSNNNNTLQIPHILIFTYSTILNNTPIELRNNVQHTVDRYRDFWNEPDAPLLYLDNVACRQVLHQVYPSLVQYFDRETQGMYKGDICRLAALYQYGGYYFDVDLRVIQPVNLSSTTQFSTCLEASKREPTAFFQAFLASRQHHPVLLIALRRTELYYQKKLKIRPGSFMGTTVLFQAYLYAKKRKNGTTIGPVKLFQEANLEVKSTAVAIYPDNIPLQQGTGCCCNYIVYDPSSYTHKQHRVHFYSRLPLPAGLQKYCQAIEGATMRSLVSAVIEWIL